MSTTEDLGQGPSAQSRTDVTHEQYVGFRLDDTNYAIPILQIREIVMMHPVTPLPNVPDFVEGLINLRGTVIPLINLRRRFGLSSRMDDEETRTIVLAIGDQTVGCIVDYVTKVLKISSDQRRSTPISIHIGIRRFISGLAQLDKQLMILLDLSHLLDDDDLTIDSLTGDSSVGPTRIES